MDKTKSNTFKGFRTFLVVGFIAFPILVIVTLINQHSMSDLVEEVPKTNLLGGRVHNNSANILKEAEDVSITVTPQARGGKVQNITGSEVVNDKMLEQKAHNDSPAASEEISLKNRTSDAGQKNQLIANVSNDSSLSDTVNNDKLLNELLAPTFDEGSCLSRYQSSLYQKASPHKPSPYLKFKLRNYEQLHRGCGPLSKFFDKVMKMGKKSSKNIAATKCKYLVWTAANGLGNRMITLAAAFLYAMLTDRVLLVRFGSDMVGLYCEPFPDSSWLLPQNFPRRKEQKHIESYESLLNKTHGSNVIWPSFLVLNLQHTHDGHNNFFHCDHSQSLLQKIPVLILKSDQYFSPSLFMIPSFGQELSKMFPVKDTVFHHLGRYLFHPSNEVWDAISRFYKAHLAKANEKIGLQVRIYNTHRAPHETIIDEILACAFKHNLLPQLDHRKSVISPSKNNTSKAVLVASLYPEYGEKLRALYLSNTTVTGEVVRVYQPSHEGHQKSNDNAHNIKAWTEIYLLSLCDALITSPKSTFGYVAQSLGGLKPWILQRAYHKQIPDPPCVQAVSMEPCLHYPPKHDCKANNIVKFTSLFPHIMHCEDVSNGLKLVDDHIHQSVTNS
ncbi:galactoside 2-alpha-L-fucosyltransferase-like isoform X1 [Prosopis cineraria]|uniref:galactoside 2-alpha-L-fucosyltransferase-like isoform X1 n=2 Tax=Prosopis cineraria TaxID=364024 RepID=UPI00240F28D7|nr:galactoside 2-alpha-L-fucosyltransferase-like isoform X1 [Prosopis cineraria]